MSPERPSIKSPQHIPRGNVLTDARILHYMKLGFYGQQRKEEAERIYAERKSARKRGHFPKPLKESLREVMNILDLD